MLIPEIPNMSFVAFYIHKPQELTKFIQQIQTQLKTRLDNKFYPYQLEQIHSTIIGCEGLKNEVGIINKWFYHHQRQIKYINLDKFLDYLNHNKYLPTIIRFAGYDRTKNYHFLSRGQHPYIRSFQLQPAGDNTLIPVLIGWSFQDNLITNNIDNLRRDAQQFNLLHKYHSTPEAIDNDFYLRLGTIQGKLTADEADAIATLIRNLLETQSPLNITLDRDNLAFVKYQDLSLPLATTEILPLTVATTSKIKKLFD